MRALDVEDLRVTMGREGILVGGIEYVEVDPPLFQELGGDGQISFKKDTKGRVAYLLRGEAYERLRWYETAALNRHLFDGWGWLWGATALAWPAVWVVHRRRRLPPLPSRMRRAQALAVAVAVLHILLLLSLIHLFWSSPLAQGAMLTLPLVAAALTAALGVAATLSCG